MLVGKVLEMVAPVKSSRPLLVTAMLRVTGFPGFAVVSPLPLVIDKSAVIQDITARAMISVLLKSRL